MLILKSKIKQIIKKEQEKAARSVTAELRKKHAVEISQVRKGYETRIAGIEKRHAREIAIFRKALSNRDRQHRLDVEAFSEYQENKAFFKWFREIYAPEITEIIRKMGGMFYHLNEGDRKEAVSRKTDVKVARKMRVVGA